MPYTYEQLSEKIEKLPEDLREAIFGAESSQILQEIGKKYALHIDKLGELVNEVGLVMVGITHPKDFIPNLAERLGVDKMTAKNIAQDVNAQIFAKVRESLKKIHGLSGEPEESKTEAKPLEIYPVRDKTPMAPVPPAAEISNGVKPVPPAPKIETPMPPAALPVEPQEDKPGMTFPEKSHASIFRTPSEVREMDGKTLRTESGLKNGGMKELAQAVKKEKEEKPVPKVDPYRESPE